MKVDLTEIRRGIAATLPFVLSHHEPTEWNRCYTLPFFGRRVRLCGRCSGIYPGIVFALLAPAHLGTLLAVAVLPLPALLDWTLTAFTRANGYNVVRTVTGAALGIGYGFGLRRLFFQGDARVLAIGIGYALVAGLVLWRREHAE